MYNSQSLALLATLLTFTSFRSSNNGGSLDLACSGRLLTLTRAAVEVTAAAAVFAVVVAGETNAWAALRALLTQALNAAVSNFVQLQEAELVLVLWVGCLSLLLLRGLLGLLLTLLILTTTIQGAHSDQS